MTCQVTEKEIESELRPYLVGKMPIAGVYDRVDARKLSLYDAYRNGTISKGNER